MFKNYLKIAWRNLVRQRFNSLINLVGLSVGMAAAVFIFLWVKNELTFDNYHPDAKQVYLVKNSQLEVVPFLLGEAAKTQLPEVLEMTQLRTMKYENPYFNIKGQFTKEKNCAYVDPAWFRIFKYEFIYGDTTSFNNHPFSLLLTASKAKQYFGNEDPIGRIIKIDTLNYEVRAVVKDNPVNSSFQFDVLVPLAARLANPKTKKGDEYWGNFYYQTFLKLTPSAKPSTVAAKLAGILRKNMDGYKPDIGLEALPDIRFDTGLEYSLLEHSDKKVVYLFAVLGILLLLIACINYVNLTTARATLRAKEVSIKKIVGAEKKQLFTQFLAESALISVLALAITLCIISLVLPVFNQFTEKHFLLEFDNRGLWMILGGTLFTTILLTGIYPAILLTSFKPLAVFRGLNVLQIKDTVLRKGLVILQFSISIVLITGTIVIYRQMQFINKQNAAYNRSQLFSFSIPFKLLRNYNIEKRASITASLKKELMAETSISDASLTDMESVVNVENSSSGSNDWDGRGKDFRPMIVFMHADSSFKKIINLQMKDGRWYQPGNMADGHNNILNETAVKEFNIHIPVIGQRFVAQGDTGVIIGVVKDFYYKSMHEKIGPVVIKTDDGWNGTYLVKTAPGKILEAQKVSEKIWKHFFPYEPFSYSFVSEEFDKLYRADKKIATLIWIFSMIAIFISCLGLFGLAAFTAEKRNKEIGIRKVLGASVANIVSLLSAEFVYMLLFSMVIAFPLAWLAMNKWLENFAYRITIGWWIFLTAAIIALLVALLTVSFQAIKAALANPVKSLRTE